MWCGFGQVEHAVKPSLDEQWNPGGHPRPEGLKTFLSQSRWGAIGDREGRRGGSRQ